MKYFSLISLMNKTAPSNPLWDSLYAVYKAESNANDSLGVYNGTAQGGLTYGVGKSGNGFVFNGTNAYVSLPNNSLKFTGNFSINIWVNAGSVAGGTFQALITSFYNVAGTNYYGFRVALNVNVAEFTIFNGTATQTTLQAGGDPLTASSWYMLTIVREQGVGSSIYVNGSSSVSNSSTIDPVYDTTQYCNIGALTFSGSPLQYMTNNSIIDEIYFYDNRLLTAGDITELYNAGAGTFY